MVLWIEHLDKVDAVDEVTVKDGKGAGEDRDEGLDGGEIFWGKVEKEDDDNDIVEQEDNVMDDDTGLEEVGVDLGKDVLFPSDSSAARL